MKKMSNSWLAFITGLLTGLVLGLWIILIFRELLFEMHYKRFMENMFSPIFAGSFTFFGVLFALFGVHWNIKNQNWLESQRTERRLVAARASLPVALSELNRICKLHLLQIAHRGSYDTKESMVMSEATQETIRTVIENSDEVIQKELSKLLAYYQIAVSRYKSFVADPPEPIDGYGMDLMEAELIISWASLRTLTGCYFDYGRGAKFELDLENALAVFKNELVTYRQEDTFYGVIQVPDDKALSRYMRKESVKGCGFLDPDYKLKPG